SAFGLRTLWSVTMSTMATVTRTAMVAIKAAFISTGVGLLIVGIGEALSALYSWWQGNEEAARQAAEAAKDYRNALQDIEGQAAKVETKDQADAVINGIHKQWLEAQSQWYQAMMDGEDELAAAHAQAMSDLYARKEEYMKTLPLQVKAAEAAKEEAAALAEQEEALRKLEEQSKAATEQLQKLHAEQEAKTRETQLSGIQDTELQKKYRLSDLGLSDIAQLNQELEELYEKSNTYQGITPDELERYKQLKNTQQSILELEQKATEQKIKQREEAERAKLDYDNQVALLKAEITQNDTIIAQIKEEQKLVELTAQYREQGFANAAEMAANIVTLEKQAAAAAAAREAKQNKNQNNISTSQGSSLNDRSYISDSKAAVGGGGNAVLLSGNLLTESKKQSKLLTDIKSSVQIPPTINVTGNVEAVIAD
ncbi:MAG: hypothetical protein SNG49_08765, partial [Rikenellaceae bacterium]